MRTKYFILALFGLLLSTYTNAQIIPSLKINTEVAVDGTKNFCMGGQLVLGYQMNDNTIIGIGTGISYTDLLFRPSHYDPILKEWRKDYKETGAYVPILVTVKYKFIDMGVSPYVSVDAGYSILIPYSENARKYVSLGGFINPHFGVEFPLQKGSIGLEAGYKYQVMKNESLNPSNLNYSQSTFAVVYNF